MGFFGPKIGEIATHEELVKSKYFHVDNRRDYAVRHVKFVYIRCYRCFGTGKKTKDGGELSFGEQRQVGYSPLFGVDTPSQYYQYNEPCERGCRNGKLWEEKDEVKRLESTNGLAGRGHGFPDGFKMR
ncbi:hypothetical protein H8D83_01245 [Candidatus Woesearchaeota archaeon]|nr:hypothetical protein [Candidatus Woesearchaeota archaeon]